MAASSAQEPSEWDEDPAWSRPDPMTAEEREAWLDRTWPRLMNRPTSRRKRTGGLRPLTAEELAEVREARCRWACGLGRAGGPPGSRPARLGAGLPG